MCFEVISDESFELPFAPGGDDITLNNLENVEINWNNQEYEEDDPPLIRLYNFCLKRASQNGFSIGEIIYKAEDGTIFFSDEYFLIPLENDDYNWAMMRVRFAPKSSRVYNRYDARLVGHKYDAKSAAKSILNGIWAKLNLDPNKDEHRFYFKILNGIDSLCF